MARKGYIAGSGSVFEDRGRRRPAEALAKAELARKIAELLNVDQPMIFRGRKGITRRKRLTPAMGLE